MPKVTVNLFRDEWYPVYDWTDVMGSSGFEAKIDSRTVAKYRHVFKEFKKVQIELEDMFNAAMKTDKSKAVTY